MIDLSVKEMELGTMTNQLKNKDARVTELEEQAKSREVLLAQINVAKEEALKEIENLKTKVIGKSTLKETKHVIWDSISTLISDNWSHFSLIGDELELLTSTKKDITKTTNELENKPDLANDIIKFLNNRTKEQLKDLNLMIEPTS
jgi:chromosome segregation ATPase